MNCNNQVVIITKIVNGGYGLSAASDSRTLFVRHALPEEKVEVRVTDERKRIRFGHVVAVHEPAPGRINPPCPYYGRCGGCDFQHADYQTQLQLKATIIDELLSSTVDESGGSAEAIQPVVESPEPFGYRQRLRMKIDTRGNPGFTHFRSRKTVAVKRCLLAAEPLNLCLSQVSADDDFRRLASSTDEFELLLNPLTNLVALRFFLRRPPRPADRNRARSLSRAVSTVDRIFFWGRNFVQEGPYGRGEAQQDKSIGFEFRGDPPIRLYWEVGGFSQVNLAQNVRLIDLVLRLAEPDPEDRILDLYCGMGNFSIPLARHSGQVLGVEGQRSAVRSAARNGELNGCNNCNFVTGNVAEACRDLIAGQDSFETIICDPPRSGMAELVDLVGRLARRRIVYISCDPATLSRDLQRLAAHNFSILSVHPVDMFPQTHHIETVVMLEKRAGTQ